MQHMETGFIRCEPSPLDFHPTETAHVHVTIWTTRPRATPTLKLSHFYRRMFNKIFHHILFTQPVSTGYSVMEVFIIRIFFFNNCCRATFRSHRMATHWVHF